MPVAFKYGGKGGIISIATDPTVTISGGVAAANGFPACIGSSVGVSTGGAPCSVDAIAIVAAGTGKVKALRKFIASTGDGTSGAAELTTVCTASFVAGTSKVMAHVV